MPVAKMLTGDHNADYLCLSRRRATSLDQVRIDPFGAASVNSARSRAAPVVAGPGAGSLMITDISAVTGLLRPVILMGTRSSR